MGEEVSAMADVAFERCRCGNAMTGVFPDGVDISAVPGPRLVIVRLCSSCDFAAGFGGPPIAGRNISLIRNTRWQ
jgi:hypothetical protein